MNIAEKTLETSRLSLEKLLTEVPEPTLSQVFSTFKITFVLPG